MDDSKSDKQYQWILGPGKAAVKRKESRIWYVVDDFEKQGGMQFGLALSLARSDKNLNDDPASSHCIVKYPLRVPACPTWLAWIITGVCACIFLSGLLKNYGVVMCLPTHFITTWTAIYVLLLAVIAGYALSVLWEALIVLNYCQKKKYVFGLGGLGVAVEPVVWRLGLPIGASFFSLMLPILSVLSCWAWLASNTAFLIGFGTGCWFYLLVALFPLRPGPGTLLSEWLLNIEDLSQQLKWAIASRFLPAGQTIEAKGGTSMACAALSLAFWVAIAGMTFQFISQRAAMELSIAGFVVSAIFSCIGLCFIAWLIFRITILFHAAYLLRGRKHLESLEPSDSDCEELNQRLALLNHLPELNKLKWKWSLAPAGTFLIRYGERERIFYWLSYGEAIVLGRTTEQDVIHVATLNGGTGFGEVAFLDDRPRTADILITQSALVASISYEQFSSVVQGELHERFREIVLASQAFEQSEIFSGIPEKDKESWIKQGVPVRYSPGDVIIEADVNERWIGLLIMGEVEVIRDEKSISILKTGNVFGEIAFLDDRPRTARLLAVKEALLWRWEPEWLSSEIDRIGLRPTLEALSKKRQER